MDLPSSFWRLAPESGQEALTPGMLLLVLAFPKKTTMLLLCFLHLHFEWSVVPLTHNRLVLLSGACHTSWQILCIHQGNTFETLPWASSTVLAGNSLLNRGSEPACISESGFHPSSSFNIVPSASAVAGPRALSFHHPGPAAENRTARYDMLTRHFGSFLSLLVSGASSLHAPRQPQPF